MPSKPNPAAKPTTAPRKPWEKNRAKFGPTHLTTLSAVIEKVQGEADEWRAVLQDALKHIMTIIDFVPFTAKFATREEQGKVKESIAEFLEMLGEHKSHALHTSPSHTTLSLCVLSLWQQSWEHVDVL